MKTADTQSKEVHDAGVGPAVTEKLRTDITSGFYNPGERINEVDVSHRYGVSRTPVREAIRQLESDGLVIVQRFRGATVVKLSDRQVTELFETREAVEGMAARLAAMRMDTSSSREIFTKLRLHQEQLLAGSTVRPPVDIHHIVLQSSQNAYLMATMDRMRDLLATLRAESVRVATRRVQSSQEHLAIAACLVHREPEAAEGAMRSHIRSVFSNVLSYRSGQETSNEFSNDGL